MASFDQLFEGAIGEPASFFKNFEGPNVEGKEGSDFRD